MSLLSAPLQAFVEVVRAGTVQGAAQSLGITQTGVTQRIRALERQLQGSFFLRSRKGMQLTEEGHALYHYCLSAKELEGPVLARIQKSGLEIEAKLSVLGPTSFMRSRVAPKVQDLLQKYQKLAVEMKISDYEDAAEVLKKGGVQFAILSPDKVSREMDSKLLKAEEYVLVAPKKWAKKKLVDILAQERLIDFDSTDLTSFRYLQKFQLSHSVKGARHFVNNNEVLLEMLVKALGYGVLTKEFAQKYSSQANICILNDGKSMDNRLALAWYPRPQPLPYFKDFISSLK